MAKSTDKAARSKPQQVAAKATDGKTAAKEKAVARAKAAVPSKSGKATPTASTPARKVATTKPAEKASSAKPVAAARPATSVKTVARSGSATPARSPAKAKAATAKPPAKTVKAKAVSQPLSKAEKTTAPAKSKSKATPAAGKPVEATPATKKTAKSARPASAGKSGATSGKQKTKSASPKASVNRAPALAKPAAAAAMPKASTPEGFVRPRASDKPWLNTYPKGVPAEIPPSGDASLGDFLVRCCRRYAGRPAFTSMDKSISFAELEQGSAAFGAFLQAKGLKKGARVAVMMPNVLQYPVAMMGILRAGFIVVNVNPLYTPRELEHQLKDSGAEAIVILENFAATLQAVIARTPVKHVIVATMGDMLGTLKGAVVNLVVRRVKKMVPAWSLPGHTRFPAALKDGAGRSFKAADVAPEDVAFLQYTGGTTGVSKGATLTHANVVANVAQLALWVEDAYTVKQRPDNLVYVCALPLYHIFALTVNAMMGMQQGARNLLIPNPRDIPGFVKELGKQPFHIFPGLNTLFNALLNNEEFRKLDFKSLVLTLGGGMAVQKGVAERWQATTGCVVSEGYGLSETSPVATANKVSSTEFTGTIGLPLPSTEIAIRDDDGRDLPLGEIGEICIKGPQVMAGYWNRPDETAKVMTRDGFFKSGDMGFMDERGYTKIVDRKKDMILVSGFNVYPNELEEVVARHPGVLEVAAIGVPDEHSGEVPKLFIVKKDPSLTEEQIIAFCRENLTGYKRPRRIEFRTELPKTNVGKILRRELRG
ncbi:long-chain-fatty-acid--CoA ligase [Arvimicrobium flavum]|uniref:long-chain-fatty-acid--CoA ligase n=1 Tax=Arvimicrobium flavum TaxID=3393320 RepID=UPI00237ACC9E|nr:long-chain-fatty-acid--CoA ligase [Mesorhizobium shangrilense]